MRHTDKLIWYAKTCHWMVTEHPYTKIEFVPTDILYTLREFKRPIKEYLMEDIITNGLQEPIMLMYNAPTRRAYVGEGNHRIAIALKLKLPLLPTRVVRTERKPAYDIKVGKILRGIDPNEFGYVKGSLYPSEIGLEAYTLDEICI